MIADPNHITESSSYRIDEFCEDFGVAVKAIRY